MKRMTVDGVELAYEIQGSGEPVVLIHGSHVADAYLPLMDQPALSDYRLIRYQRRGLADSNPTEGSVSIKEQANDCSTLLRQLGVEQVHVAGHSYGGVIALQLALDAPDLVHSLVLMEPALLMVPSAERFMEQLAPVAESYQRGDKAGAVEMFLQGVGRPNAREIVERAVPGGFAQAARDADTFFQVELPALQEWRLTQDDVRGITQPVLYVMGGDSLPIFLEVRSLIHEWLPQANDLLVPGVTHFLQMENAKAVAEGLKRFFKTHPVPVTSGS